MKKLIILMCATSLIGCTQIEDGNVGVKITWGKINNEELMGGLHFFNPIGTFIEKWNVKLQELKETACVPSSEGLISQLDISVLFSIPPDMASDIRRNIGENYKESILEPYVRESIRNVASGYQVKALFSDAGRKEIGLKMMEFLKLKLDHLGIEVKDVLLRDVRLPEQFSDSISEKLRAEQQALQKEFELQKAKKDAEIEIARAEGVAKSNQIIADSITSGYLKYLWIQGMKQTNHSVVYVPTETNLPLLESTRWLHENEETKVNSK